MSAKYVLLIPAYNYGHSLPNTLAALKEWHSGPGKEFHVCVIDDGSNDNTHEILEEFIGANKEWFQSLRLAHNQGKGAAIKKGFQLYATRTEYIFFTDCDLHYGLPILTDRFVPLLAANDVVIADRSWVASSNHEAVSRQLSSYIFNRLTGLFTGVNLRDSQAGCKGFSAKACAPIFDLIKTEGFSFDVEVLSMALFYRLRIAQVPVRFEQEYDFPEESSVKLFRTAMEMIWELIRINLRWKRGYYKNTILEERINETIYTIKKPGSES